ncbi:MAG: acetyl-CoA carboxylase biotin carboxylase subunit [Thermodesulfobacteriota bacterium]
MFNKILIANRGEIAVRIIRSCRKLGIATVAVYSDPDIRSLHVLEADEAVALGGKTAAQSYLDMGKLLDVARKKNCEAVHPGYGFLSENKRFAEMVSNGGIVFIGPPASAIGLLGDKTASRAVAEKAGVPVIPGGSAPISDLASAQSAAGATGYPVLIKPAAGGGGKGMRIVHNADELEAALKASRTEAEKAFGDDRVFIERYITRPRHIEIQVVADHFGNVIYLGERECSIQRRYQKVIEEAPSPAMTPELREKMGQVACSLTREAGYVNAGTVEFVMDESGDFFFLEMNTRLQVEHPVTEMVIGMDLVALQLRIADGQRLPLGQAEVSISGWAIEARINAEDPDKGFFPATGMITRYAEPREQNVRVDSGVHAGSLISVYYDSLLAKVIAWGKNREEARQTLVNALNGYHIEGVVTNMDFVNRILNLTRFQHAELATDFIEKNFDDAQAKEPPDPEHLNLLALATTLVYHNRQSLVRESLKPMVSTIGGSSEDAQWYNYVVKSGDKVFHVALLGNSVQRRWHFQVDGRQYDVQTPPFEFYRRRLKLTVNGEIHRFILRFHGNFTAASFCGIKRVIEVYTPREWELAAYMPSPVKKVSDAVIRCPMPGQVVDVRVKPGDRVYRGQEVVILESMKMESGVASTRDGIVAAVKVKIGQTVESGDSIVEFEKD